MSYTAQQITQMAQHIRSCTICGCNDADIVVDTYAEDLLPEELDGYIRSARHMAELGRR